MSNNPLVNLKEERIQSVIDRLGHFREILEYGQLDDDIRLAIECMEYLRKRTEPTEAVTSIGHWIVRRGGVGGRTHTCSVCGNTYWDMFKFNHNECECCHSKMDRTITVYND